MRIQRRRAAPPPPVVKKPVETLPTLDTRVDYATIVQQYKDRITNRKTAIRAFCIQCTNGQVQEVRLCPATKCALHPYRMGDDPNNLKYKKSRGLVPVDGESEEEQGGDE